MRIMYLCVSALLPIMVLSTCVTIQQSDHVFPTQGEYFRWQFRDFIQGDQLTYSIDPTTTLFTLEQPLHQLGQDKVHPATGFDIVAIRAYDIPETGAWTNHFAMMGYDEFDSKWKIYYAEGEQIQMNVAPDFKNEISFIENKPLMKCFDLEYVDADTFLVDCAEREADFAQNYVYFVKKGDLPVITPEKVPNHKGYTYITDRKVQYHVYNSQNIGTLGAEEPQRILLRGQYAYGTPDHSATNLDGNCVIELLQNTKDNVITDANTMLDRGKLIADLNIPAEDQDKFFFTLIDFKVMPNGDVYVLDAFNGIYVYYINDVSTWKYKKKMDVGASMAYAFDVNIKIDWQGISHLHIVVMHQTSVTEYLDGVQQKGWLDAFTAGHPAFIFASQQFIVVNTANDYLIYNSDHSFLIHKEQLLTKIYLVNPYEPDMILVSNSWARRYEIGHARISIHSDITTGGEFRVDFWATDTQQRKCEAFLKYQVIPVGDTTIYDVDHDPFPEVVTYPADPFFLQEMAAGPNLIYKNGDDSAKDHVVVTVHTAWELNVTGIEWPTVSDVAYADILIDPHWPEKNKFWFLYQHVNKQVQIFECLSEAITSPNVNCESHDKFTLPNTLDRTKSQFDWYAQEGDFLTFQFIEHDYQITFYQSDHGETSPFYELKYTQVPENKITSFTILKQGIYVVLEAKKQVDVWFALNAPNHSITSATMQAQGSFRTFSPKKIFGNPALKSEFILILSTDCIFFGDMRNTFTLIKVFDIILDSEVNVYLGMRTIFIVYKPKTGAAVIQEWNYESLSNIYLLKTLPTYRYEVQSPLTTDFCYETGFLFVRALDPKEQKTVILVYESNVLAQLSLHKVIDTHLLIEEGTGMNMASAGRDQMFMYVNNQQSVQKMVGFLRDAIMTIAPTHLTNQYITTLNAAVDVTNQENPKAKQISYPVKFINTQTYIAINQESLTKENTNFVFVNQKDSQFVTVKTDSWQMGQVLKYEIDCVSCQSHLIEVQNPVYHLTDGSKFVQHFYDGAPFGTGMVYQTAESLVFQDEKGELGGVYKLPISGTYNECYSITASDDAKLVFSGCLEKDNIFIYLSFCDGKTCTPATPAVQQIANGIKYASKLMYKDGVLFVLDNNHDRPTLYDGNLRVHKVTLDEAKKTWDLDAGVVINSQYLSTEPQFPVQVADFDVIKFQVGNVSYYKIILTSTLYRVWFVHMYWDNGVLKLTQHDKFDLSDFINKSQVLMVDTRFYQVKSLKQTIKESKLLATCLISTNNLAAYAITFTFDVSDPTAKGSPVSTTATMPFLLSNYGTWKTLNKMSVYNDHAVLAYTDQVNVIAAVYLLPTVDHLQLHEGETKVVTFIGGEKDQQYTQVTTKFVLALNKDPAQTKPVLYTNLVFSVQNQETFLIKYGISDYPQLHVQNGDQIPEQNIYLTAYNDYNSAKGVLRLTKKNPGPGPGPDPNPDDDSGSSSWWWITLIVVLGVALLAVGGYFVYAKFIKNSGTPLHVQSY